MNAQPKAVDFLEQFEEHIPVLRGILWRMTRNVHDVEDIVQDIYVRLHEKARNPDAHIEEPLAYMVKMARNRFIDIVRARQETVPLEAPASDAVVEYLEVFDPTPTVERQLTSEQQLQEVVEIIKLLPQPTRRYFILARVYGMKASEIATQHDIVKRSVERHIAAALRFLALKLGSRLPEFTTREKLTYDVLDD